MRASKLNKETVFSKIIQGELPAEIVYRNKDITAFRSNDPKTPIHILIVPNKAIPTVKDVNSEDVIVLGQLFIVAAEIAKMESIDVSGYRLIVNCNKNAGQEVFHLHMHLLGGQELGPLIMEVNNQESLKLPY
jgi:histidine triad (HIT) family protein